ncbi:MAG: VTT domain-containing protein [Opitutaceae bacterium]|nr:VTT domain-containing protein [Opitutaceae bacterium]
MAAAVLSLTGLVDWRHVRDGMQELNPALLLALMAVLPLFGFPISVVYVMIGALFGGPWGVVVVTGITLVHLTGSHWIGHSFLRRPLRRWMERRDRALPDLPKGENVALSLMTALMPGLPYFVRNYLLALSGIPLLTYLWICWPVYVARSCVMIFLGDFTGEWEPRRLLVLGGVFLLKVTICALIVRHLRAKWKAQPRRIRPARTARPEASESPAVSCK